MARPYYDCETEGLVYLVTPGADDTCHGPCFDSDLESSSSDVTMHTSSTIASDEIGAFFREAHGRMYPMDENLPMTFPTDENELQRHQMRHAILKTLLRGNHVGPVQHILRPRADGSRPRILDIRTCCGTWAQEMATEFPHCDIVSVDVVPTTPHVPRPNIVFEVYDLYQGLVEDDQSFDYISCRNVQLAVKQYDRLLFDLHRVLRPGGLLSIGEIEHRLYEVDKPPYTTLATKSFPRVCKGIDLMRNAIANQGVDLEAIHQIGNWLKPRSEWWKRTGERYQIPGEQIAQASTGIYPMYCQVLLLPTGPWHSDPMLGQAGLLMNRLCRLSWTQVAGVLVENGMSEDEVQQVCKSCVDEWVEAEQLGTQSLIKYWIWWGLKPDLVAKK